jgi:hypothetical protein
LIYPRTGCCMWRPKDKRKLGVTKFFFVQTVQAVRAAQSPCFVLPRVAAEESMS